VAIRESQGVVRGLRSSPTPMGKKKSSRRQKMSQISIGKEVLEAAIEIEKNGRSFYEALARQDRSKEARDVFARLAVREKEHENTYKEIMNRLGSYNPRPQYAGEHDRYVSQLVSSSIFTAEQARRILAKKSMTDIEAIEVGINLEKDSILFYSEVRGMVPGQDQEIVDVITSEEKKHLSELLYMTSRLRGKT
jgi:rubrerythrin